MKNTCVFTSMIPTLMFIVFLTQPIHAEEIATREECVAKVDEAIQLIQKEGLEPALEKIMDKDGPFIWKDSYVFCLGDEIGRTLAHPITNLLGFPMERFKDADGNQPFIEVLEVANKEGKGWKKYNYMGRGQDKPRMKNTYFVKVPGKNVIVCAGYYE